MSAINGNGGAPAVIVAPNGGTGAATNAGNVTAPPANQGGGDTNGVGTQGTTTIQQTANTDVPPLTTDNGQGNGGVDNGQGDTAANVGVEDPSQAVQNVNQSVVESRDFPLLPSPPAPQPPPLLTKDNTFQYVGDPHATSGDGQHFNNELTGTFTLIKSQDDSFDVETQQGPDKSGRWPGATLNHTVAVKSGSDVIKYDINNPNSITINGKTVPLADANLNDGTLVHINGGDIDITTPKGDSVTLTRQDGYIDIKGSISSSRAINTVAGALGVFDGGDGDPNGIGELVGRDGTVANVNDQASLVAFENSWRTTAGENLF